MSERDIKNLEIAVVYLRGKQVDDTIMMRERAEAILILEKEIKQAIFAREGYVVDGSQVLDRGFPVDAPSTVA